MNTRITTILASTLLAALLTTPANAAPHDRVDELGSSSGVAVAAPADIETEFGRLGFRGVTPPPPEPVVTVTPAAPADPEPTTAQGTGITTTEAHTEPAAPTRDAAREPAPAEPEPEPEPVDPAAPEPTPEPAPPASGGVLGVAASLVGTPYVYGGTSPGGFDCSGYTSYVFAQVGINLPRTAAAQQAYATPVTNPQPGDLVFWGYPAYHVGIYAGNGMVYDAGNPGTGVVYRSVFSGVSGYGRVG